MSDTAYVAADQLKSYIERIERLHEDRKAIADDISEIFQEMKGSGFSIPVVKKIIADRAKDPAKLAEFEALLELYLGALEARPHVHARGIAA
jgi:uncharacterized protein (UPF0335 family)